jgi:hypothetical protein
MRLECFEQFTDARVACRRIVIVWRSLKKLDQIIQKCFYLQFNLLLTFSPIESNTSLASAFIT